MTFTREELEEAARRVSHLGILMLIISDVLAHREPDYLDGKMYEDANGFYWMFCASAQHPGRWLAPGTEESFPHAAPMRPLRLLVPEGK